MAKYTVIAVGYRCVECRLRIDVRLKKPIIWFSMPFVGQGDTEAAELTRGEEEVTRIADSLRLSQVRKNYRCHCSEEKRDARAFMRFLSYKSSKGLGAELYA